MIFSPHADDAEFGIGGTIAKATERGHTAGIVIPFFLRSELGEDLGTARQERIAKEAEKAARILGCDLNFITCDPLIDELESIRHLVEHIRSAKPELVLVNHPRDSHPHHSGLSRTVMKACYLSQVPTVKVGSTQWPIRQLLFYETFSSISFLPQYYVDVSKTFSKATRALRSHELGMQTVPILMTKMTTVHMMRGVEAGVLYAEGIRLARGLWYDTISSRDTFLKFLIEMNEVSGHST